VHDAVLHFLLEADDAESVSFGHHIFAPGYGLILPICYNFIYTYIKRVSAFAIIPGSLVGALPPLIGWAAANGSIWDPRILIFSAFFFIGQIPHFWIVLLKYGKEYEEAGFPSISKLLDSKQLQNLTFIWIFAVAITALMLPLYHIISSVYLSFILILFASVLSISFITLVKKGEGINHRLNFVKINMFYLIVMILTCLDKVTLIP